MWLLPFYAVCSLPRIPKDPRRINIQNLAGIAMYSSIMKTKTRPGDWLVLPGAGGGLGHM